MHSQQSKQGVLYGIIAYVLWGLLPIYWKSVQTVPSFEILCHRTVWSFLFLLILLCIRKNWSWLKILREDAKTRWTFLATSLLLGCNWLTYIWAVNHGFIVESSLGYFINPIVNVLLGVLVLKENLRKWQWSAVILAALGVLYLTFVYGKLPWIALTLALSFGFYGLLRKTARLGSMDGLSLETFVLFIPFVFYLIWIALHGKGQFGQGSLQLSILLIGTGIATALPLLSFASAARRIRFSTVGLLQYIAPTLQFSIGVLIYKEAFTKPRLIGFVLIWAALIIYTVDSLKTAQSKDKSDDT